MKLLNKRAASALAVGLLASGLSLSANAAYEPMNGKSEVITKNYGIVQSVEYDKNNNTGTISPMADSGPMDGGYWIHGKRDGYVVSEYKHYTKQGHASVVNGAGYYKSGGWKDADIWSKASLDWSFWGTNKAYYDYR